MYSNGYSALVQKCDLSNTHLNLLVKFLFPVTKYSKLKQFLPFW